MACSLFSLLVQFCTTWSLACLRMDIPGCMSKLTPYPSQITLGYSSRLELHILLCSPPFRNWTPESGSCRPWKLTRATWVLRMRKKRQRVGYKWSGLLSPVGRAWLEETHNKPFKIIVPMSLQKMFFNWMIGRKEVHCNKWDHPRNPRKEL